MTPDAVDRWFLSSAGGDDRQFTYDLAISWREQHAELASLRAENARLQAEIARLTALPDSEATCGELSCDDCNERYAVVRAENARLRAWAVAGPRLVESLLTFSASTEDGPCFCCRILPGDGHSPHCREARAAIAAAEQGERT